MITQDSIALTIHEVTPSGCEYETRAHNWGQYTPAVITTDLTQKYLIKISILQSCATQVGIHQEKNELSR